MMPVTLNYRLYQVSPQFFGRWQKTTFAPEVKIDEKHRSSRIEQLAVVLGFARCEE
jgi:hypothetical protein